MDMDTPGIDVRPIKHITGARDFAEVFFTDCAVPLSNVVGSVNDGWRITMGSLAHERGMSATTGHRRFEEEFRRMVAAAKTNGAIDDPLVRQRLARYYSKIQILRINGLRNLTAAVTRDELTALMAGGAELEELHHELESGGGAAAEAAREMEEDVQELGISGHAQGEGVTGGA